MQTTVRSAREDVFENLPIPSALAKMILPAVTSQLIVLIYNMADTFFVGQTDNPYMVAATSLILPVFNLTLCLAGLAGIGGGSLISRLLGQNREDEARRVSAFALRLSLCVAAAFSIGMGLFMRPVLQFLGAGENTYRFAKEQGVGMIFDECQIDTDACTAWEELKAYINRKLAWNTEEDVRELTLKFFKASYGPQSDRMLKIFDEYIKFGETQKMLGFSGFRSEFIDPIYKVYWQKEMLLRWEREMSEAVEAYAQVEDENQKSIYIRNVILERASVRYLLASVYADDYPIEELQARRMAASEDIRTSGITNFAERVPIKALFDRWGIK